VKKNRPNRSPAYFGSKLIQSLLPGEEEAPKFWLLQQLKKAQIKKIAQSGHPDYKSPKSGPFGTYKKLPKVNNRQMGENSSCSIPR
jgi:hypothetical protein